MRQSQLFTKTRKEAPTDEVSRNAQLLIRAGFIAKEMAGVYSFLPLGLRVTQKISNLIRKHLDDADCQELKMTILQDPEPWQVTGRWNDDVVDVWFKTELNAGGQIGLGMTHEEPLIRVMKQYIHSYRDLPMHVYQIQAKLRNELRAKSGIMRGREFLMKDLYSFSSSQKEHEEFYSKMRMVYEKIFAELGLGDRTWYTYASGGSFSQYSHEFQTLTDVGEDTIYLHHGKKIAINKEVFNDEVLRDLDILKEECEEVRATEVGNIFPLATGQSKPLGLSFENKDGEREDVYMGSYGIGITRVMGVIAELLSDKKGLVWPAKIAPFFAHILVLDAESERMSFAESLYSELKEKNVDVLLDDRALRPGEKFADADLIGVPYRIVVSEKSLAQGGVEVKGRQDDEVKIMTQSECVGMLLREYVR